MDAEVWAALIAAMFSLAIALITLVSGRRNDREARKAQEALIERQNDLQGQLEDHRHALAQQAKLEERAFTAKAELDRAREPLLAVAVDLADRINNIRNRYFLAYLSSDWMDRGELARLGTLYRFARYWCVAEGLNDRADIGKLLADKSTHAVASTLKKIGQILADDQIDGGRLMIWREEQRAIAERVRDDRTLTGCVGYATFVENYDDQLAKWFGWFDRDLESAASSERFRRVQEHLALLVQQLAPADVDYYREVVSKLERRAQSAT